MRVTHKDVYEVWRGMIRRCFSPDHRDYPEYGARGITVCDRWRSSFQAFVDDMGPRPTPKHTLDRWPNGKGSYEPGNCRWATPAEQNRNRPGYNCFVHFCGQRRMLIDWATMLGISYYTLHARLNKRHWSVAQAFTQSIQKHRAFRGGK